MNHSAPPTIDNSNAIEHSPASFDRLTHPWRHERIAIYLSFLTIMASGYGALAFSSWQMDFQDGVIANLVGILTLALLLILQQRGVRLSVLISALQIVTIGQAFWMTWLTGGIYSATISWLALSPLPGLLAYSQRARIAGLVTAWGLILALYIYALMGGEVQMQVPPQELINWHLMIAIVIFGMQMAMFWRTSIVRKQRLERLQQYSRNLRHVHLQLKQTQAQKDRFVTTVSHELRTPMNAIMGLADLIQHDKRLSEDLLEKVSYIQKSGEHLLTIINDLLDHAQMEAGRLQVVKTPINLRKTIQTSFQLLKRRAESKPLAYTLHMDAALPEWVLGDSHRLTQILVNLLGNAIKFSAQGSVQLCCTFEQATEGEGPEPFIRIEVRDTGMGIPKAHQHLLFQNFSQTDPTIAQRFGGNGLGLSITKGLVTAMGGHISFESEEGLGTRFIVDLPCEIAPAPTPINLPLVEEKQDKVIRILIADDNQLNRQIASLQMRQNLPNAVVEEAVNGLEAFMKVRDGRFDVVLMDLLMPEMGGLDSCIKIRKELPEPQCSTPIIALTANTDRDELNRCLEHGMNECMLKPFNRKLLTERVLSYVA